MHIDNDAAHGGREVVPRPDSIVPIEVRLGVAERIWVNQYLVAVEPKPCMVKVLGPVDTVGVMSTGWKAFDIDMPEVKRPVVVGVQLEDLDRLLAVMGVEEEEFDGDGIPGEDREVHTLLIDGGAERVGSAGLCLVRTHSGRGWRIGT
jgi:hypothetical protein